MTPLREGGSLPAIVEADDLGMYVVKFRGAGQGPLALVAELVGGEIGRALSLPVPEIVFVEIAADLGRNEPDPEIRELLQASVGLNLGLDYLPGSVMFDPAAGDRPDADLASRTVWFDALIANIDRTPQNPNLLVWHGHLHLIDHGAALYFHHQWPDPGDATRDPATAPFAAVSSHVLLPWAERLAEADRDLRPALDAGRIATILDELPDGWASEPRGRYLDHFVRRLEAASVFVEEAERARAGLV